MLFCRLPIFFKIIFKKKNLSGILSECQTVWILIRPDVLLGLIWVKAVCKSYQQTTLVGNELMLVLYCIGGPFPGTLIFTNSCKVHRVIKAQVRLCYKLSINI